MLKMMLVICVTTLTCYVAASSQDLSLEEKVGQLLMVHFHGQVANEEARTLIQEIKVGGIIYYNWSNGLYSPEQVRALSMGLQKLALDNARPIPLLIAADQEWGIVARLKNGFTQFPGNKALGETGRAELAQSVAFAIGQELRAVGVNMNLAPVVDVNSNPRNPVIGVRAFGDNPKMVSAFGKYSIEGYKKARVIATLKHFPGYGDVAVDPHEDLPVIHKSMEELESVDLLPFAELAVSAEAVMTAHILVPALDSENCSTLSEKTLKYLRETLGFKGVIVADSLVMDGVVKKCHTVDEAVIQALQAGCDLLILGGRLLIGEHAGFELKVADVQRIHKALVDAVKAGRISEERVDQAVEKILALKKDYTGTQLPMPALENAVNTPEHKEIAQEVASRAVKVFQKEGISLTHLTHLREKKIAIIAPQILKDSLAQTSLLTLGKDTQAYFYPNLSPTNEEIETAKRAAQQADIVLICSYNAWKIPVQATLIKTLLALEKSNALVVTRDPLDTALFPEADVIYNTFCPTSPSLQAVYNQLSKR